jgi:hypothetical protein
MDMGSIFEPVNIEKQKLYVKQNMESKLGVSK